MSHYRVYIVLVFRLAGVGFSVDAYLILLMKLCLVVEIGLLLSFALTLKTTLTKTNKNLYVQMSMSRLLYVDRCFALSHAQSMRQFRMVRIGGDVERKMKTNNNTLHTCVLPTYIENDLHFGDNNNS